jgi:hypothetical protein
MRKKENGEHGQRMLTVTVVKVAIASVVLLNAARADQYPDYQPLPVAHYGSYQEKTGIAMAVIPMLDVSSQKTYLGVDLAARGFLPVYVVIENHSDTQSVILLRDQLRFSYQGSAAITENPADARPNPSGTKKVVADLAIRWGGVPAVVAFYWASKMSNVRMNLLRKELRSQTVAPSKTGGGFAFVPNRADGRPAEEAFLDVPVQGSGLDEEVHFYFRIKMSSEGR